MQREEWCNGEMEALATSSATGLGISWCNMAGNKKRGAAGEGNAGATKIPRRGVQ